MIRIMNLYLSNFNQSSQIGQIHVKQAPLRVYGHNFSLTLCVSLLKMAKLWWKDNHDNTYSIQ